MLETPPGYNDVPSWLPESLQGAYRTLNDPLVQMSPVAGVTGSLPTGIRVMRTSGTLPQRQLLDNVLSFIQSKVPSLTRMIGENFDARINVASPRLDALGYAKYPRSQAITTSSPIAPTNPPFLNIKIHPKEVVPENTPELAKTLIHEFLHPKMDKVRPELLSRIAPKAMETLLAPSPTGMRGVAARVNPTPNPAWYQGRELLEELAVRMMEQNIAKKKLGF